MIFLVRSTSCGGKDTFIKKHFKDDTTILSSDFFRSLLCGNENVQQYNKNVFSLIRDILDFRLSNRVSFTVYNATNLRMKDSSFVFELAKKHRCPVTIISIIPPDIDVLLERNKSRFLETGKDIPKDTLYRHHNRYYKSIDPFIDEAKNNSLVKFIEIDQDYEVIREI